MYDKSITVSAEKGDDSYIISLQTADESCIMKQISKSAVRQSHEGKELFQSMKLKSYMLLRFGALSSGLFLRNATRQLTRHFTIEGIEYYMSELKDVLKLVRRELNMTQTELADVLQVYGTSVSRWEVGKVRPNEKYIAAILQLAKSKEISPEYIQKLQDELDDVHKETLHVTDSPLFPVDKESICEIVDDSPIAFLISDMETDELIYANHAAQKFFRTQFKPDSHQKCYEIVFGRDTPCEQCTKGVLISGVLERFCFVSPTTGNRYIVKKQKIIWKGRSAHAEYFQPDIDEGRKIPQREECQK